ncbi:MAG: DinB family protein [Homoserinimonas sp.]|jgi:hypothetical protein|nr:DinB family protein [Homoserinimonas sp.]
MPITPDTKNWTWTAERQCPECGFDGSTLELAELPRLVRENAAAWSAVLERPDVRTRPDDHTWSPLEYAAHVRDVNRVYAQRLQRFLVELNPEFQNWDQDASALADRYNEQNPLTVANELAEAAEAVAAGFEGVPDDAWARTASRSDGAKFTLGSFARYFLHDLVHHRWDVTT